MELIYTHDAMRDLLTYSAPGARVEIRRVARGTEMSRGYSVTLERLGHAPINFADSYALPCPVEPIRKRVREMLDAAVARSR